MLISGDVDFATPAPFATEVLPSLRDGHQVVLHNLGHTEDSFNRRRRPAFTRLVNAYFDTGRVDQSGIHATHDELPPRRRRIPRSRRSW